VSIASEPVFLLTPSEILPNCKEFNIREKLHWFWIPWEHLKKFNPNERVSIFMTFKRLIKLCFEYNVLLCSPQLNTAFWPFHNGQPISLTLEYMVSGWGMHARNILLALGWLVLWSDHFIGTLLIIIKSHIILRIFFFFIFIAIFWYLIVLMSFFDLLSNLLFMFLHLINLFPNRKIEVYSLLHFSRIKKCKQAVHEIDETICAVHQTWNFLVTHNNPFVFLFIEIVIHTTSSNDRDTS